ncbi:DEAD/DEAH box helicase family protein [Rhodopirellula sp. JC740]|uniref:DEAD/DEAH box helicase family protein n=1 Tax=Rhodopirellula halodulae TaxID=2894198 RepID=A0ABS8NKD0_9BACT|nr:DEAD/DEAH box helicase family protein [Rhodopirellula sp. JC740]MCC9644020.1 DEAD/DEAH box helicase family protein [Rhodopirellula sp. JC740]
MSTATLPSTASDDKSLINLDAFAVQPRPYQQRIIQRALEAFGCSAACDAAFEPTACADTTENGAGQGGESNSRPSSVLIESPTGSGKTVMGLAVAAIMQRTLGIQVGWVAMRRNLLIQAQAENARREFGVDMRMISMFDKNPPSVDLLVVDEAQHDAATSMANLHGQIQPQWTLGLSATPYRTDRIKLCFENVIRDAGIAHLIADGYLSPYHHYTIEEYSPETVATLLVEEPERWGKSLVFFHKQTQCDELKSRLDAAGIRSDIVTAKTDRERQLARFVEGQTDVLINMAILTEGFDCPSLKTVFCRPSGQGTTIQMAGRVLRQCESEPVKQVVQCRHTRHPMMRTAIPAEQYLWTEYGWRSISGNRQLDAMALAARQRVAKANVSLPKLIAAHRPRRRMHRLTR